MIGDDAGMPVGACVREWSDPNRAAWNGAPARPLQTMIWYPMRPGTPTERRSIAIFRTGRYRLQSDRPRPAAGRHPLVVVSHGTGGAAASIAWLCHRLAAAGFVVAAVNHHGATAADPGGLTVPGAVLWWERAVDLSRVLDRMRDDPVFGSVIDVERASVAGFSIGAYAALATVGARLRIERWRPHCDMHPDSSLCRVPPEAGFPIEQVWEFLDTDPVAIESLSRADLNYRDPRFIAAVAIAPVAVPLLDEDSVTEIVAPVLLVGASNDDQSRLDTDVHPLRRAIPHSELTVIDGAGHYTFLSEGTLAGRLLAPRFVRDPRGVRRREVHDRVAREALRVLS